MLRPDEIPTNSGIQNTQKDPEDMTIKPGTMEKNEMQDKWISKIRKLENSATVACDGLDISTGSCQTNPLLMSTVLSVLFPNLDLKTLKVTRQVCHIWEKESRTAFRSNSCAVLRVQDPLGNFVYSFNEFGENFLNFMKMMKKWTARQELPFDSLRIEFMRYKGRVRRMLSKSGHLITSLSLVFHYEGYFGNEEDDNFNFYFRPKDLKLIILYWFPNLKSLELEDLDLNVAKTTENIFSLVSENVARKGLMPSSVSHLTTFKFEDRRPQFPLSKDFVFHLLRVLPDLTTLEVSIKDTEAITRFLEAMVSVKEKGFLSNIHKLTFGSSFTGHHVLLLVQMNFSQLKELNILKIGEGLLSGHLELLLNSHCNSLEIFRATKNTNLFLKRIGFGTLDLSIKMQKLKHLEITCRSVDFSTEHLFTDQFPNLRTCVLDTDCSCEHALFPNLKWNTIIGKCPTYNYFDQYRQYPKISRQIKFDYKSPCFNILPTIRRWLHIMNSIYLNIKTGYRSEFTDIFKEISQTDIEELHVDINCRMFDGGKFLCCPKRNTELEEEIDLQNSRQNTHVQNYYVAPTSYGMTSFLELRSLKIVSQGCRKFNMDTLHRHGIMQLLANAPKLKHFIVEYSFQTSSRTVTIFQEVRSFEGDQ